MHSWWHAGVHDGGDQKVGKGRDTECCIYRITYKICEAIIYAEHNRILLCVLRIISITSGLHSDCEDQNPFCFKCLT